LTMEFDLSRFHDRYRDALMQLIQAKVEGKELPSVTKVEGKPTQDLMAALKASLAAAKAGCPAALARSLRAPDPTDPRRKSRDAVRFHRSQLRTEMGRDAADLFPTRQAAVPASP